MGFKGLHEDKRHHPIRVGTEPLVTYQKLWSWNRTSNTTRTKRALRRARRPASEARFAHGAQEENLEY